MPGTPDSTKEWVRGYYAESTDLILRTGPEARRRFTSAWTTAPARRATRRSPLRTRTSLAARDRARDARARRGMRGRRLVAMARVELRRAGRRHHDRAGASGARQTGHARARHRGPHRVLRDGLRGDDVRDRRRSTSCGTSRACATPSTSASICVTYTTSLRPGGSLRVPRHVRAETASDAPAMKAMCESWSLPSLPSVERGVRMADFDSASSTWERRPHRAGTPARAGPRVDGAQRPPDAPLEKAHDGILLGRVTRRTCAARSPVPRPSSKARSNTRTSAGGRPRPRAREAAVDHFFVSIPS